MLHNILLSLFLVVGPTEPDEITLTNQEQLEVINSALNSYTLSPRLKWALLLERGNLFLNTGDFERALSDFTTVVDSNPDPEFLQQALVGQGESYLAMGKTDQFMNVRVLLINIEPPVGFDPNSEAYYLTTFPDTYWGGSNWSPDYLWRPNFERWMRRRQQQYRHRNIIFTRSGVQMRPAQPIHLPPTPLAYPRPKIEAKPPHVETPIEWHAGEQEPKIPRAPIQTPEMHQAPHPQAHPAAPAPEARPEPRNRN